MRRQSNNRRLRREILIYFKGFAECVKPRRSIASENSLAVELSPVQHRHHFLLKREEVGCAIVLTVNAIVSADHESCGQAQDAAGSSNYKEWFKSKKS
jgi:hypothetical protein